MPVWRKTPKEERVEYWKKRYWDNPELWRERKANYTAKLKKEGRFQESRRQDNRRRKTREAIKECRAQDLNSKEGYLGTLEENILPNKK